MAIVDGRTSRWTGSTTPVDLAGAAGGTSDTEIKIEGTNSYGEYTSNTRSGLLWDNGSAIDLSNNHIYIWINCGIAGLLALKASGGMRVRCCGNTVTDFFEVNVAGKDDYPNAVKGGWVMYVIDIEEAFTNPDATGGTKPATSAIRFVGYSAITDGTMPRMADNTWMDAIWTLPTATPGIRVEGQNWTWDDIVAASDAGAWGTCNRAAGGGVAINTPIQFGANDAGTHGFSDTNQVILWEDQPVATGFYSLSIIGGTGVQSFEAGIKTGAGNDASGGQGWVVSAASTGQRWSIDADDSNIDAFNLYGCTLIHGDDFQVDSPNVSMISNQYIDITTITVDNSEQLKNIIINANTADGVAFMKSDDMSDIVNCDFSHSDGHAIELTAATPTSQNNIGNLFSGYTNVVDSTDAAILNSAAGALAIASSGGSNIGTDSYRNTGGGSVTISNDVSVTFSGMRDNSEVRIFKTSDNSEVDGIEIATAGTTDNRTFTWSAPAGLDVYYVIHHWSGSSPFFLTIRKEDYIVPVSDTTIEIDQQVNRNAK